MKFDTMKKVEEKIIKAFKIIVPLGFIFFVLCVIILIFIPPLIAKTPWGSNWRQLTGIMWIIVGWGCVICIFVAIILYLVILWFHDNWYKFFN